MSLPLIILLLCTGVFPKLKSKKIILQPDKLLDNMVTAIIEKGTIGVVTPLREQLDQTIEKWNKLGLNVIVDHALPYADVEQVVTVAKRFKKTNVNLIVLDCIGFNLAMKKIVKTTTKKPVILPRTLLARTIMELVI